MHTERTRISGAQEEPGSAMPGSDHLLGDPLAGRGGGQPLSRRTRTFLTGAQLFCLCSRSALRRGWGQEPQTGFAGFPGAYHPTSAAPGGTLEDRTSPSPKSARRYF